MCKYVRAICDEENEELIKKAENLALRNEDLAIKNEDLAIKNEDLAIKAETLTNEYNMVKNQNADLIKILITEGFSDIEIASRANLSIEEVEAAMKGMLAPKYEEKVIGNAEVRQTFRISNVGTIAGAYVLDGKLERNAGVRVLRDNVVIHEGKLASLKRFKDDAKEVSKGFECGIQIEKFNDIKEGDILEAYILEEIKR